MTTTGIWIPFVLVTPWTPFILVVSAGLSPAISKSVTSEAFQLQETHKKNTCFLSWYCLQSYLDQSCSSLSYIAPHYLCYGNYQSFFFACRWTFFYSSYLHVFFLYTVFVIHIEEHKRQNTFDERHCQFRLYLSLSWTKARSAGIKRI